MVSNVSVLATDIQFHVVVFYCRDLEKPEDLASSDAIILPPHLLLGKEPLTPHQPTELEA